ncbi:MAG TPA: hypothetical protein VOA41_03945 [Candidatus Dormibacteraeota bacterium]|nr:hypothetical protein [Candidatus Dormibacteraeota bacterium]
MSVLRFPIWQKPYQEALLELNSKALPLRIAEAEKAISLRSRALAINPDGQQERQALDDALFSLLCLKREKPNFPNWQSRQVRMD